MDNQQSRGKDAGASFPEIAASSATTAMSLHAFLMTPHGRMPNIQLSRDQINNVAAYILSLRGH